MLRTLDAKGKLHGYAITAHIMMASRDLLRVEEGSLYPALHRMEQEGLVKAEWGTTEKNREAKFYTLTAAGRKRLKTVDPMPRRTVDTIKEDAQWLKNPTG